MPVCPWYFPFLSEYETSGFSPLKNKICAAPLFAYRRIELLVWFENSKTKFPCQPASRTVGGVPSPHLAYVDLAVTKPVTFLGILKYSKLLASANEFGGININS